MTRPHQNDSHGRRLWKLAQGEQDLEMEHHLTTCDACQEELFTLRQLAHYQQMTGGSLVELPSSLHATLTGLFGKVRPDLASQPQTTLDRVLANVRRITATLIVDTGTAPQTIGLRGGNGERIRQVAFVSDVGDLDLEISSRGNEYDVVGQLGMDNVPPGLLISFSPVEQGSGAIAGGEEIETSISNAGHFSLTLPSGEWVASVRIHDVVLLFAGIHL